MRSCKDCPKRSTCRSICPEVESQLPDPDAGRSQARYDPADRAVAWAVQDREDELTPRQRLAARLHFRFGLTEAEAARRMGVAHQTVSRLLARVENTLRGGVQNQHIVEGRDILPPPEVGRKGVDEARR